MSVDFKRSWNSEEDVANGQVSNKEDHANSNKRPRPNSDSKPRAPRKTVELETDTSILQRRQKQIDYGKNTFGYINYMNQVPRDQRTKEHPKTPDKYTKYSRRSWDTLIKMWRKELHKYDTGANSGNCEEDSDSEVSSNYS